MKNKKLLFDIDDNLTNEEKLIKVNEIKNIYTDMKYDTEILVKLYRNSGDCKTANELENEISKYANILKKILCEIKCLKGKNKNNKIKNSNKKMTVSKTSSKKIDYNIDLLNNNILDSINNFEEKRNFLIFELKKTFDKIKYYNSVRNSKNESLVKLSISYLNINKKYINLKLKELFFSSDSKKNDSIKRSNSKTLRYPLLPFSDEQHKYISSFIKVNSKELLSDFDLKDDDYKRATINILLNEYNELLSNLDKHILNELINIADKSEENIKLLYKKRLVLRFLNYLMTYKNILNKSLKSENKNKETSNINVNINMNIYIALENDSYIKIEDVDEYIKAFKYYVQKNEVNKIIDNCYNQISDLLYYFKEKNVDSYNVDYYINYLKDIFKYKYLSIDKNNKREKSIIKDMIKYLDNIEVLENTKELKISNYIMYSELLKILKQRKNYTYADLMEIFNICDDECLVFTLLNRYQKEIEEFDYQTKYHDHKYIEKYLTYIGYSLGKINIRNLKMFLSKLEEIELLIRRSIIKNSNNFNNNLVNTDFMLRMNDDIDNIIKKAKKHILISKNKIYDIIDDDESLYYNLHYLVFDLKNYNYVKTYLNIFPASCMVSKNGKFLFEEIVDNYICHIKSNYYEFIYEKKLIDLFISNSNILGNDSFNNIYQNKIANNVLLKDLTETIISQNEFYDTSSKSVRVKENDYIITLDTDEAKVLENAFSIKKMEKDTFIINIYTSDITSYMQLSDFDIQEYVESDNQKFILNSIAKDKFSLDKNKERPAVKYQIIVDKYMNVISFSVEKKSITIANNIYYKEYNNVLNKTTNEVLKDILNNLNTLGKLNNISSSASSLNTNLMHLANNKITSILLKDKLPFISRTQPKKIVENNALIDFLEMNNPLNKNMYSINNLGSKLLDEAHAKVTTPLRDIDAYINQLLLLKYYACDKSYDKIAIGYYLDNICNLLNSKNENDEENMLDYIKIKKKTFYL